MHEREDAICQALESRFDFLAGKCAVTRERRIFAEAPREKTLEVIEFLRDEQGFDSLCTMTGMDSGEHWEIIYHLARGGIVMNLKAFAPKADPVFDTVTGLFAGATMYELEIHNLLGVTIRGIPGDIKYPLPDDWPEGQYPLRKEWQKQAPAQPGEGS